MSSETFREYEAAELQAELERLEQLAVWLDARYRIPFTSFRFGLDSVVGLIPGIGDGLTMLPAAYLVYRAHRLGVPVGTLIGMGTNVALDAAIGAIPIIGDIFDVAFKANRRNVGTLRRHLERRVASAPAADRQRHAGAPAPQRG